MKVIICGAGPIGSGIAEQLVAEGNDVTVIGTSDDVLNSMRYKLDLNCINGSSSHPDILAKAGAKEADIIIAVTAHDEVNMVTCFLASTLFGIKKKIARIRHFSFLGDYQNRIFSSAAFPIDLIISPEKELANAILNRLHVPGANETFLFSDKVLKVVSVKSTKESLINTLTILQANKKLQKRLNVNIFGLLRNQEFSLNKDLVIRDGDELYLAVDNKDIKEVLSLLGHEEQEARKIRIIGGGRVGLSLAHSLSLDSSNNIKIIERNKERAKYLAENLNDIPVINGDALEKDILKEINIETCDTIIAVSNDDEVNILSSLLAKKLGCSKAISLINSSSFAPLFSSLGIDVIINPREITVSSILKFTREIKSKNIYSICEGQAELIEANSYENSFTPGKKLQDLNLPEGVEIVAISRDGKVIIPKENFIIESGDNMIIISYINLLKKVEKIFSHKFKYV